MAKIIIVGPPGSGKTYLSEKLKAKGYPAYDADSIEGLSYWVTKDCKRVKKPDDAGNDWYKTHDFMWDRRFLENFLAGKKSVFLFGFSDNVFEMLDLFDKAYYLYLPLDKVDKRLTSPERNNPYGREKEVREEIIKWLPYVHEDAKKHGLIFINTTLALEMILEKITG